MTKIWCQDWDSSVYTDAALADAKAFIGIPLSSGRSVAERFPSYPRVELRSGNSFSDFVMAGPMFLVSGRLKAIFEEHAANAEFFEVCTDSNATLFYCNFLETVDCLNRDKSFFTWEENYATNIRRIVLDAVKNEPPIYRVAMTIPALIAVRDDLANSVISSGMTGLVFKATSDWSNPMYPDGSQGSL